MFLTSCQQKHHKEVIVYQLEMEQGDFTGHAVVESISAHFDKSKDYEFSYESPTTVYTRLGIVTKQNPAGGSIISVVIVGVNRRNEPLIMNHYTRLVPEDGVEQAAHFIFEDFENVMFQRRGPT
jgi:hypothetical protein